MLWLKDHSQPTAKSRYLDCKHDNDLRLKILAFLTGKAGFSELTSVRIPTIIRILDLDEGGVFVIALKWAEKLRSQLPIPLAKLTSSLPTRQCMYLPCRISI